MKKIFALGLVSTLLFVGCSPAPVGEENEGYPKALIVNKFEGSYLTYTDYYGTEKKLSLNSSQFTTRGMENFFEEKISEGDTILLIYDSSNAFGKIDKVVNQSKEGR